MDFLYELFQFLIWDCLSPLWFMVYHDWSWIGASIFGLFALKKIVMLLRKVF